MSEHELRNDDEVLVGGIAAEYRFDAVVHWLSDADVAVAQCGTRINTAGARSWYVLRSKLAESISCRRCLRLV